MKYYSIELKDKTIYCSEDTHFDVLPYDSRVVQELFYPLSAKRNLPVYLLKTSDYIWTSQDWECVINLV